MSFKRILSGFNPDEASIHPDLICVSVYIRSYPDESWYEPWFNPDERAASHLSPVHPDIIRI